MFLREMSVIHSCVVCVALWLCDSFMQKQISCQYQQFLLLWLHICCRRSGATKYIALKRN